MSPEPTDPMLDRPPEQTEVERLRALHDSLFDEVCHTHAEIERLKAEVEWLKRSEPEVGINPNNVYRREAMEHLERATQAEARLAEIEAGCDIQKSHGLYRQVPVVVGPGKTQAEIDRDDLRARLAKVVEILSNAPFGPTRDMVRAALAAAQPEEHDPARQADVHGLG